MSFNISGTITINGSPLQGVGVINAANLSDPAVYTDVSGNYTLVVASNGLKVVTPNLNNFGFNPVSQNIFIVASDVTGVDFASQLQSELIRQKLPVDFTSGFSGVEGFSGLLVLGNTRIDLYTGDIFNIAGNGYISGFSSTATSGVSGFSGFSANSGVSGASGTSGGSGTSGYSGISGGSGTSGFSGFSSDSGVSGFSGFSAASGASGFSGFSAPSGLSGFSGGSGTSGFSGFSGASSTSGFSGFSADSGVSGFSGGSGASGFSGFSANSGASGFSGFSADSGVSGTSGFSGFSANSGASGFSGFSANSGISGFSGASGFSGFSANSGASGFSGFSANSGASGFSGFSADSGVSGTSGFSGFSANSGISGFSGFSSQSGFSGFSSQSGTSGFSGNSGFSGGSGFSGFSGGSGSSGTSGFSGFSAATFSGTKFIFLDVQGGVDDVAAQDITQMPMLNFIAGQTNRGRWTVFVPDDWILGTNINIDIYWSPKTGAAGNVFWFTEAKSVGVGSLVSGTNMTNTFTQATPAVAYQLTRTGSNFFISGASMTAGDLIQATMGRSGNAAADTYVSTAQVHHVRLEYQAKKFV